MRIGAWYYRSYNSYLLLAKFSGLKDRDTGNTVIVKEQFYEWKIIKKG